MHRVLLLIATSAYDQIVAKGTDWVFQDTEKDG